MLIHTCTREHTHAHVNTHMHTNYSLLYSPTTTACGHSFCRICLSRSFDFSPLCPVCRSPLAEVRAVHTHTHLVCQLIHCVFTGVVTHTEHVICQSSNTLHRLASSACTIERVTPHTQCTGHSSCAHDLVSL